MAWDIAVVGTVTLDDVTTPAGRSRDQVGGSAVYFALAAARQAVVRLCGAVGSDGVERVRALLEPAGVELTDLDVISGPTCRWRATHDFERWVTASEHEEEGVLETWIPRLSPATAAAPVLFLASLRPDLQTLALAASHAHLVGSDSMTVHIGAAPGTVRAVVEASDVLFLNRTELAALTRVGADDWRAGARSLIGTGRLRAVVVKAGPVGAALITKTTIVEREAHPVDPVVDPTGAGDSLAGGVLGACAAAERSDDDALIAALDEGLRTAADGIGAFGTAGVSPGGIPTAITSTEGAHSTG